MCLEERDHDRDDGSAIPSDDFLTFNEGAHFVVATKSKGTTAPIVLKAPRDLTHAPGYRVLESIRILEIKKSNLLQIKKNILKNLEVEDTDNLAQRLTQFLRFMPQRIKSLFAVILTQKDYQEDVEELMERLWLNEFDEFDLSYIQNDVVKHFIANDCDAMHKLEPLQTIEELDDLITKAYFVRNSEFVDLLCEQYNVHGYKVHGSSTIVAARNHNGCLLKIE